MKQIKYLFSAVIVIAVSGVLGIAGCQKSTVADTASTSKQLSMYLTDGPSPYDSVFVDIRYVEVKMDTSTIHQQDDHFGDNDNNRDDDHVNRDQFGKWDTLAINPGIYNISRLRNGIDTLMGTANVTGTIRKIRITLGGNNSLQLVGVSYPLIFFPGTNNYLYIKINNQHHHELTPEKSALWIDFDISRSIVLLNGKYYLNPVLRPFCNNNFAAVKGMVLPAAAAPLVTIFNATDTANAIPNKDGFYMIRGIKSGTYSILFKGSNGYRDSTIQNIQLQTGGEKIIPSLTLSLK